MTVAENIAFPLEMRKVPKRGSRRGASPTRCARRPSGARRTAAARALGRTAAARGACARGRVRPEPAAARRAVRRARPQAARADAARGAAPAAAARPDGALRHPRPGGGARPVRSHRGDGAPGASRSSARRRRSTGARPTASSPTSSASRTSFAPRVGGRRVTPSSRAGCAFRCPTARRDAGATSACCCVRSGRGSADGATADASLRGRSRRDRLSRRNGQVPASSIDDGVELIVRWPYPRAASSRSRWATRCASAGTATTCTWSLV